MLSCPRCGGAAAATSTRCEFCHAPLLVKACPRCLARVFHGHKHCPHCGAATDDAAAQRTGERNCPRCKVALAVRAIEDVELDECPSCVGVFIDAKAIERMLADRQQARAEAVVGVYRSTPRYHDTPGAPNRKLYINCPQCGTIMNRKQFARGSNVIVDVCKGHGTWFDAGELPVVVEFVRNGGLERAERAEIEKMKEDARRAKRDAQAEQARASMTTAAPARGDRGAGLLDAGGALVDLFFSIWR